MKVACRHAGTIFGVLMIFAFGAPALFAEDPAVPPGWEGFVPGTYATHRTTTIHPVDEMTRWDEGPQKTKVSTWLAVPVGTERRARAIRVLDASGKEPVIAAVNEITDEFRMEGQWDSTLDIGEKRYQVTVTEYSKNSDSRLYQYLELPIKSAARNFRTEAKANGSAAKLLVYRFSGAEIPGRTMDLPFSKNIALDASTLMAKYEYLHVNVEAGETSAQRVTITQKVVDLDTSFEVGEENGKVDIGGVRETVTGTHEVTVPAFGGTEVLSREISGENWLSPRVPGHVVRSSLKMGEQHSRTTVLVDYGPKDFPLIVQLTPLQKRTKLPLKDWAPLHVGGWQFQITSDTDSFGKQTWKGRLLRAVAVVPENVLIVETREVNSDFTVHPPTYETLELAATGSSKENPKEDEGKVDEPADSAIGPEDANRDNEEDPKGEEDNDQQKEEGFEIELELELDPPIVNLRGWQPELRGKGKVALPFGKVSGSWRASHWISEFDNSDGTKPWTESFWKTWKLTNSPANNGREKLQIENLPQGQELQMIGLRLKRYAKGKKRTVDMARIVAASMPMESADGELDCVARLSCLRQGDADDYSEKSEEWSLNLLNKNLPGGHYMHVVPVRGGYYCYQLAAWGELEDPLPTSTKDLIVLVAKHKSAKAAAIKRLNELSDGESRTQFLKAMDKAEKDLMKTFDQ